MVAPVPAPVGEASMAWLFFSPAGRISRWPFAGALIFWSALQGAAVSQMFANEHEPLRLALWAPVLIVVALLSVVSSVMLAIKRAHDIGLSGLFVFLLFIPVISLLTLLAFIFWPSAPANQYGAAPNSR